ncbi:hypothetical protein THAOC_10089, partial [Thalassiosira oceanica]
MAFIGGGGPRTSAAEQSAGEGECDPARGNRSSEIRRSIVDPDVSEEKAQSRDPGIYDNWNRCHG